MFSQICCYQAKIVSISSCISNQKCDWETLFYWRILKIFHLLYIRSISTCTHGSCWPRFPFITSPSLRSHIKQTEMKTDISCVSPPLLLAWTLPVIFIIFSLHPFLIPSRFIFSWYIYIYKYTASLILFHFYSFIIFFCLVLTIFSPNTT